MICLVLVAILHFAAGSKIWGEAGEARGRSLTKASKHSFIWPTKPQIAAEQKGEQHIF